LQESVLDISILIYSHIGNFNYASNTIIICLDTINTFEVSLNIMFLFLFSGNDHVDDHHDVCQVDTEGDSGKLEGQLVDKITEGGGIRTVPSRQSLDDFTQK